MFHHLNKNISKLKVIYIYYSYIYNILKYTLHNIKEDIFVPSDIPKTILD